MVSNLALEADLCYNKLINMFAPAMVRHPGARIRSLEERIVTTLPPHAQDGNPTKTCSKCKRTLPATTEFFSPKREYKGRKARLYSHCRECKAETDKAYAEKNKGKIKLYKDGYNATHRDQRKCYDMEHKEQIYQNRKIYTESNRERISDVHRRYCEQYYQTEQGRMQMRVSSQNRRSRKRNAEGSHTLGELQEQHVRQKGRCYYCKKNLGKSRNSYHADHIVPLAKGGTNYIDNIVLACSMCNQSKQDKMLHEWESGGRLL